MNRVNGKKKPTAEVSTMPISTADDSETSVLAAAAFKPEVLDWPEVKRLKQAEFFDPAKGALLTELRELAKAGAPTSHKVLKAVTRNKVLGGTTLFDQLGGDEFLAKLYLAGEMEWSYAKHFADKVREAAVERRIDQAALNYFRDAKAGGDRLALAQTLSQSISDATAEQSQGWQPKTFGEFRQQFPTLRPPIIQGLMRVGETMNLIAPPKSNKSWLVNSLILTTVGGGKWLDSFQTTAGRVMIFDNELHEETISFRMPEVAAAMGLSAAAYEPHFCVESLRGKNVDIHKLGEQYLSQIQPGQFQFIVIDAFYRILPVGTDENSNAQMTAIYNLVDQFADRLQCGFVLIHHSTKGSQSEKRVTDVGSGAGAQSRAADAHVVLRDHAEQGAIVLEAAVRSFPPLAPLCLRWDWPLWMPDASLDPSQLRTTKGQSGGLTLKQRALQLFDTGPKTKTAIKTQLKLSGSAASDLCETLLEEGQISICQVETASGIRSGYCRTDSQG